MSITAAQEFVARLAALPEAKQLQLRKVYLALVDIMEHPELPAVLVYATPCPHGGDAHINAFCLGESIAEADALVIQFATNRIAAVEDGMPDLVDDELGDAPTLDLPDQPQPVKH